MLQENDAIKRQNTGELQFLLLPYWEFRPYNDSPLNDHLPPF